MKANAKWTVLAMAVSALVYSAAASAADNQNASATINHDHTVTETRTNTNTNTNTWDNTYRTTVENQTTDVNTDVDLKLDAAAKLRLNATANLSYDGSRTDDDTNITYDKTVNVDVNKNKTVVDTETTTITADEKKEKNNHGQDANVERDSRLSSDISLSGEPTVTGEIEIDSAATAMIDNRQSISGNKGLNDKLTNDASISDDVASEGSGNLGFNVAAGDNNAQDNAAALSAADSSFAFGMADAAVFVNQSGMSNVTINEGVTNAASIGDNAFSGATGNIGVNVASGNNNGQKNALSASVATSRLASAAISSNQVSSGNFTKNEGTVEKYTDTTAVTLRGSVDGYTAAVGYGGYSGSSQGSFSGTSETSLSGTADQIGDVYPEMWANNADDDPSAPHPGGDLTGHMDLDSEVQGATDLNGDGGALAFTVDADGEGSVSGSTSSQESGELGFIELGVADLYAQLSGSVTTTRWVVVDATNTASLSGSAFSTASGNIGVNVAAGTGNLQANSLALAVAQPSTGGGGGGE